MVIRRWSGRVVAALVVALLVAALLVGHDHHLSRPGTRMTARSPVPTVPAQLGAPVLVGRGPRSFDRVDDGFAVVPGRTRAALGIAHTADGGATWRLVAPVAPFGANRDITQLLFANPSDGLAVARPDAGTPVTGPNLYRTTDGGRTWSVVDRLQPVARLVSSGHSWRAVTGTTPPVVWTSTDHGATWHCDWAA